MPSPQQPSVIASALAWFRERLRAAAAPPPDPAAARRAIGRAAPAAPEMPASGQNIFNSSLLFRCMDMLAIDRHALAQEDPLLFRELRGRCAACRSRASCNQELARELDDAGWDAWRAYCPNSSTLLERDDFRLVNIRSFRSNWRIPGA
jgi:hypothetical protein